MNKGTNRFYLYRKDIAALAKEMQYDADTASLVYSHKMGWSDCLDEMVAWRKVLRQIELSKTGTLYDLFYK